MKIALASCGLPMSFATASAFCSAAGAFASIT
jgi:hypothetical protein